MEELGIMSKNRLRWITLVRGPIRGTHSLTLMISWTILIPQGFCKHADAKTKLDKYVCQKVQQLFLPERSSCVFFKMDNSTKRLFEVVIDDLDEVLSQAVDKHEREEAPSNDELDEILSQSLDMFDKVKNSVEDATDITDMFEFGRPSLVVARRFAIKKR